MAHIENEIQYHAAMARIEELLPLVTEDTPVADKNSVELILLSNLVADYDEQLYPINTPSLPDILKLRMYERNLSQKGLAELLQTSPSRINEIITGKREPTFQMARQISIKLTIDASIVLGTI